jgi:bacterioferritin B
MLISKELNDAINAQIGREFGATHQYVAIATYFDSLALKKLAQRFYKQGEEEREHAMKFVKYLVDAGGDVRIPTVDAPKAIFKSVEEAVKLSLDWELEVTRLINNLMDIAVKEKDYIAQQFLDWYTNEQLEEVSTMDSLLRLVQRTGEEHLILLELYAGQAD